MVRLRKQRKGFSLIEAFVVLGIMILVLGIVIANFPALKTQIALNIAVHELQLTFRQAQSYAIAVREFDPSVNWAPICLGGVLPPARFPPYGVSIAKDASTYVLFADIICAVKTANPQGVYNSAILYGFSEVIATKAMQGGMKVSNLKGGSSGVLLDMVEVIYQRPSPSITLIGRSGGVWANYNLVDITLSSINNAITKDIRIRTSGQVSIQ